MNEFAILTSVPLEHLVSGASVANETGFVAYGSKKWDFFRRVDELRNGAPVPVLIYPSYQVAGVRPSFKVSWVGNYIGSEESGNGQHSSGLLHRPPSTFKYSTDNNGHWAVFWHVQGLKELEPVHQINISDIMTIAGKYRKGAPPRGPEMIELPSEIAVQ